MLFKGLLKLFEHQHRFFIMREAASNGLAFLDRVPASNGGTTAFFLEACACRTARLSPVDNSLEATPEFVGHLRAALAVGGYKLT